MRLPLNLRFDPRGDIAKLTTQLQDHLSRANDLTNKHTDKLSSYIDIRRDYGVPIDGTDATARLIEAFGAGGEIYVPEGDYLIAAAGSDTGGVYVNLTKTTRITCHPKARFYTNGLDNDMIRFTVPSTGTGLPADGIDFEWHGGVFDQRGQKNSTVIPFIANYPATNAGASATCDGLSVYGYYTSGTVKYGINRCVVLGVTTIGGAHWETAGGDSGVFMAGCRLQETYYCRHVGNRDLGFYSSGDSTGVTASKCVAHGNVYEHCFGGVAQKRSSGDVEWSGNTFINNSRPMAIEHLVGTGARRIDISGNTGWNCNLLGRITYANGGSITNNHFTDQGAFLADGTTSESAGGVSGWNLRACTNILVRGNTAIGMGAAAAAAYPATQYYLFVESYDPGSGAVDTSYCRYIDNVCDGWRSLGTDAGTGNHNSLIGNLALNATAPNGTFTGATLIEHRLDTNNVPVYNTAVQFIDGTGSAPPIARKGQASVGIFFATSKVGIAGGSGEKLAVTSTGVGFQGATAIAKPTTASAAATFTANAGTAVNDASTFDGYTLKQIVKALRDYGLLA